jgi:hypothetical protein
VPQSRHTAAKEAVVGVAYTLGGLSLAGEAAVHLQQYALIFHKVRWIGPLFLANAAACVAAIAGLAYRRTRRLAALAGVAISAVAMGTLVVSYGRGLFGWREGGFRTPIALAVIAEVGAVIFASAALAVTTAVPQARMRERPAVNNRHVEKSRSVVPFADRPDLAPDLAPWVGDGVDVDVGATGTHRLHKVGQGRLAG